MLQYFLVHIISIWKYLFQKVYYSNIFYSSCLLYSPDGDFVRGRRYINEILTITLPEGVDVCDISTLTIWCQPFRTFFGRALLTRDVFVSISDL